MALPVTISATRFASEQFHHGGPYISSGGNVYIVLIDSVDQSVVEVHKATDPTSSFTEQDSADKPNVAETIASVSSRQVGDVIHISTIEINGGRVAYHTFNMATDQWGTVNETVKGVAASTPTNRWCDIAVRSADGDVIIQYSGSRDTITMTDWNRVKYARREGGVWTVDVAVDNAGAQNWDACGITPGSNDRMHLAFTMTTSADNGYQRCLRSDNTLETFPSPFSTTVFANEQCINRGTAYESGGATKVRIPYKNNVAAASMLLFDSADTPSLSTTTGISTGTVDDTSDTASIVAVAKDTDLHLLWVDATSLDLMRDLNSNDGGWGTDATEFTGTINGVFANVFVRSGNYKLAYVVLDTATVKYNELDLGAVPSGGRTTKNTRSHPLGTEIGMGWRMECGAAA